MEYSIRQLADIAGVSTRTLRYYDERGLLKPSRVNEKGCRYYEQEQVDLLQQILFYRERNLGLDVIKEIISNPQFDAAQALEEHLIALMEQEVLRQLEEAVRNKELPESETGHRIVLLHKDWLGYTWKEYSAQAHKGLASMYIADERFLAYYDKNIKGCGEFLVKAVDYWAGR